MRQAALFLVLILAAALAQAQDVSKRKSGLWEIKSSDLRNEKKTYEFQMCIDQATDDALQHLNGAVRKETCKVNKVQRSGDQTTVDAVCSLSKTTAKTHAVFTGKFDSAYKVESKSTFDPPLRGKTDATTTMEARWLGPCAADQKPGDVVLANGKKVNANDQAKAKSSFGGGAQLAPGSPSSKQSASPPRKQGGTTPAQ